MVWRRAQPLPRPSVAPARLEPSRSPPPTWRFSGHLACTRDAHLGWAPSAAPQEAVRATPCRKPLPARTETALASTPAWNDGRPTAPATVVVATSPGLSRDPGRSVRARLAGGVITRARRSCTPRPRSASSSPRQRRADPGERREGIAEGAVRREPRSVRDRSTPGRGRPRPGPGTGGLVGVVDRQRIGPATRRRQE